MITSMRLVNFRCFDDLPLEFDRKHILLSGPNGQGKSSVLEAIFFLANLRSFRTSRVPDLIRIGSPAFHLSATVSRHFREQYVIEQTASGHALSVDGRRIGRSSDFCGALRTIAFLPDDPLILTGASQQRRRFFDMFISMMDREYFRGLQKYITALKARNLLLRENNTRSDVLAAWDDVLAEYGAKIVSTRAVYARMLGDFMRSILLSLRPELANFQIVPRCGRDMDTKEGFAARLKTQLSRDRAGHFTSCGPHTDDFDFQSDGKLLRICGSRGQCRIVSFAMKMAELEIVNSGGGTAETIVLIDDAAADLDRRARDAFYEKIESAAQIFHASAETDNALPMSEVRVIVPGRTTSFPKPPQE